MKLLHKNFQIISFSLVGELEDARCIHKTDEKSQLLVLNVSCDLNGSNFFQKIDFPLKNNSAVNY